MKISAQKKLGLKPRQAVVVSEEIENFLWDKSFLGNRNPEVLLRTTFYLIGLNFGMRAGDEHRKLSSTKRGVEQGGKSPFSLLSEPISPSSLKFNFFFSLLPTFSPISPSSQLCLGHFSLLPILFLPLH